MGRQWEALGSLWEFLREWSVAMNSLVFPEEIYRGAPCCALYFSLDEEGKPWAPEVGKGSRRRPIRGQAFLCPDSTWVTLRRGTVGSYPGPQCPHLQAAISLTQNLGNAPLTVSSRG